MYIFTYHTWARSSQVWKKGQQVQSEADAWHLPHWARSHSQSLGSATALELQTAAVTCLYLITDIHHKHIFKEIKIQQPSITFTRAKDIPSNMQSIWAIAETRNKLTDLIPLVLIKIQ